MYSRTLSFKKSKSKGPPGHDKHIFFFRRTNNTDWRDTKGREKEGNREPLISNDIMPIEVMKEDVRGMRWDGGHVSGAHLIDNKITTLSELKAVL